MTIEKPKPLYNPEGQVDDPKIAKEMAEEQEYLKNNPNQIIDSHKKDDLQESIDSQVSDVGKMAQIRKEGDYQLKLEHAPHTKNYEIKTKEIAEKLKGALSPEELDLLKKFPKDIIQHFLDKE